jgi:DNA-binding response OmpR family regulator
MRLLAVEDEPALADLLRGALVREGFAVDTADGLEAASDCLAAASYDAVILDLGLADGDGLSLLGSLRRRGSPVPVLILTARGTPEDRVAGLDGGADDYLVKPFHMNELIARVRALLRRPNAALGVVLELGNVRLDTVSRSVSVAGAPLTLTPRETSLLTLLLRRHGRVVAREAIEEGLYAFDDPTSPNALEVLVHRLRRRLADAGAAVTIHTVRGVGYLLGETR